MHHAKDNRQNLKNAIYNSGKFHIPQRTVELNIKYFLETDESRKKTDLQSTRKGSRDIGLNPHQENFQIFLWLEREGYLHLCILLSLLLNKILI